MTKKVKSDKIDGKPKCKGCGFRIRGKVANHELGLHHKNGANGKATVGQVYR